MDRSLHTKLPMHLPHNPRVPPTQHSLIIEFIPRGRYSEFSAGELGKRAEVETIYHQDDWVDDEYEYERENHCWG